MHDTFQLRRVGQKISPNHFKGVFGADQIPWSRLRGNEEWSFIVNTDPISKPGEHWIAVAQKPGQHCVFFDSYGNKPAYYNPVLWRSLNRCQINAEDYQQDTSTVCGDYALYFLSQFHHRPSWNWNVLKRVFDPDDDPGNDLWVQNTMHRRYPQQLDKEKHDEELKNWKTVGGQTGDGWWKLPKDDILCLWEVDHFDKNHLVDQWNGARTS